jgi:hypothetical protein
MCTFAYARGRTHRTEIVDAQAKEIRRQLSLIVNPGSLADLSRFFDAELPERDIYVNGILSPTPESKNATATYVRSSHNRDRTHYEAR